MSYLCPVKGTEAERRFIEARLNGILAEIRSSYELKWGKSLIPTLQEACPWISLLDGRELGWTRIRVNDIVGTDLSSKFRFFYDWKPTPSGRDFRWVAVYNSIAVHGWDPDGYIYEKVYVAKLGNKYFVTRDGNRRVSVLHMLNFETVEAHVTEYF